MSSEHPIRPGEEEPRPLRRGWNGQNPHGDRAGDRRVREGQRGPILYGHGTRAQAVRRLSERHAGAPCPRSQAAGPPDPGRMGVCPCGPGGIAAPVPDHCRQLREQEPDPDDQPRVLKVGRHIHRRADGGRDDRPARPPRAPDHVRGQELSHDARLDAARCAA